MRALRSNPLVGVLVAGSLMVSSTAAVAATTASAVPQVSPWATLTALSGGAPATALCGAAAVAAASQTAPGCVLPVQDVAAAPAAVPPPPAPVPPVEPVSAGMGVNPLLLGLGALALGALIFFLVRNHNNNEASPA